MLSLGQSAVVNRDQSVFRFESQITCVFFVDVISAGNDAWPAAFNASFAGF